VSKHMGEGKVWAVVFRPGVGGILTEKNSPPESGGLARSDGGGFTRPAPSLSWRKKSRSRGPVSRGHPAACHGHLGHAGARAGMPVCLIAHAANGYIRPNDAENNRERIRTAMAAYLKTSVNCVTVAPGNGTR